MSKRLNLLTCAVLVLLAAAPALAQPPAPPASAESPRADASPRPTQVQESVEQSPGVEPAPYSVATPDEEAERERIWNSPAMRQARARIVEHAQYSARIDRADVERQLTTLRNMSASEMHEYLKQFNQRLAAIRHGEEAAAAGRDRAVNDALKRQRQTQQVYENYSRGKDEAADMLRDRRAEQLESQRIADAFRAGRSDRLMSVFAPRYNPFAPTFDPASPSHYTRAAAAATLPGDLPAGDPRNFAVDVVGVDGPGPGTVILRGGGTVPNVGAGSGAGAPRAGGAGAAPAAD